MLVLRSELEESLRLYVNGYLNDCPKLTGKLIYSHDLLADYGLPGYLDEDDIQKLLEFTEYHEQAAIGATLTADTEHAMRPLTWVAKAYCHNETQVTFEEFFLETYDRAIDKLTQALELELVKV